MRMLLRGPRAFTATTTALLLLMGAGSVAAQSGAVQTEKERKEKGDPVIIALAPDDVVRGGTVKIVRDHRKQRTNIVYLGRSWASSLVLESAMRALVVAQLRNPHVPGRATSAVLRVAGGASADPATIELFARLKNAPPRAVGEAGRVPAVVIYLPHEDELRVTFKGRYEGR